MEKQKLLLWLYTQRDISDRGRKNKGMKSTKIEMIGKTFGNARVICEAKGHSKTMIWYVCKCLKCGKSFDAAGTKLRQGKVKECRNCRVYPEKTPEQLQLERLHREKAHEFAVWKRACRKKYGCMDCTYQKECDKYNEMKGECLFEDVFSKFEKYKDYTKVSKKGDKISAIISALRN